MKTTTLELVYDREADAAAVYFQTRRPGMSVRTKPLDDRRLVDYDVDGRVAFVELLRVSEGVALEGLPEPELVREALARLAAEQGWARQTA